VRLGRMLTAAVTLVGLTVTPAMADDGAKARAGGTQVAINQVRWDGGDTLIPLPGETRARELGVAATAASPYGCDPGQFCTYVNKNYTGMIDRMSSCTSHKTHGLFVSYVNNQTRGTRARLYDKNLNLLSYTKAAPDKGTTSLGYPTFFIRPC
jgi:hypothetical protein